MSPHMGFFRFFRDTQTPPEIMDGAYGIQITVTKNLYCVTVLPLYNNAAAASLVN